MTEPSFSSVSLKDNQAIRDFIAQRDRTNGKAMDKLKKETASLLQAMERNGLSKPATILNFNPVPLVLDGGLANFKVPSIVDPFVQDEDRFHVKYKGRKYKASVLTIRSPRPYPILKDVQMRDGVESGDYDAKACRQIEIAYAFFASYSSGERNSSGTGGVVAFEGDRHLLNRDLEDLEIDVPAFQLLDNGWREYFTERKSFADVLAGALDMQRRYCNSETQRAQSMNENDGLRLNITDIHRIWHQYEMDMGWRQVAAPWTTQQNDPAETCSGCGEPKKRVEAYFCKCGRPYDPFKAYMAGELPITSDHLVRVPDERWAAIRAEEVRRQEVRKGMATKPRHNTDSKTE